MAQDDKMNEKGDATSLRKAPSSVVDDFLQALFARHPPPQDDNEAKVTRNDQQVSSASATGVKRDRTPDEFEEYEMLSKRKEQNTFGDESTTQRQDIVNMTPETRMLVRRLPPSIKRRDLLDHFSKYGTILEAYVKNSSGHVQFDNAESCQTAVQEENGKILKGVVLELEVDHRPPHKATREFTRPRPFGDSARDNSMDMDMSMSQVRNPNNGYQGGYTGNYSSVNGYQRDGQYELSRHITGSSVRRPYAGESGSHLSRAGRGSPGGMRPYPPRQHGYSRTDEFGRHNRFDMQSRQFRTQQSSYTGLSMSMSNGGAARDMGRPPMHGPVRGNYQMSMSTNSRGRAGGPVRGSYTSQRFDRRSERRTETIQAVNVPFVQAVVLGNVSQVFTDELERAFRERSISIRTRYFQRELFIRDAFVTKLVTEGVKALIIIEEGKSAHGKIYMQVFELDEGSGPNSYRFDEYDSLSVEEALAVLEQCKNEGKATRQVISSPTTSITSVRSNSNTRQTQQQVQYSSPGPSQAPQPVQAQPQQAPLPQVSAPASVPASVSAAAANLLDPNTLTTLINVVKGMIQQPAQQPAPIPQSMPQQPPVQQATVPVSQPVASIPQQTYNGYTSVPAYSPTQAVAPLQSLQTSAPPPPSPQQQQATAQTSGLLNNSTIQQLLAAVVGNPAGFTSGYQQPSFGNFIPTQPSAAAATTQTQPFQSHPQQQLSQPKSAPPQGFNTFNSSQVSDLLDKLQFLTRQQNPVPQHP